MFDFIMLLFLFLQDVLIQFMLRLVGDQWGFGMDYGMVWFCHLLGLGLCFQTQFQYTLFIIMEVGMILVIF